MSVELPTYLETEEKKKGDDSNNNTIQESEVVKPEQPEQQDNDNFYAESDGSYTSDYPDTTGGNASTALNNFNSTPDPVTPTPILVGRYCIDGDTCHFKGNWGMGMNYRIEGITSEFHYTMHRGVNSENPDGPQSGFYSGHFWMKVHPPKKVPENRLLLTFVPNGSQYFVSGGGNNRLGVFSVKGKYNPETTEMICMKIYAQKKPVIQKSFKPVGSSPASNTEYLPTQSSAIYSESSKDYKPTHRHATPSFLRESSDLPEGLNDEMKLCFKVLTRLIHHKWAEPFRYPVDPSKLNIPDYFDIIKEPMDFSTIQKQITNRVIVSSDVFATAIRRVFDNAIRYNKAQDDVYVMAKTLSDVFEKEYAQVTRHGIFEDDEDPPSPVYKRKPLKRPGSSFGGNHHLTNIKRQMSQVHKSLPTLDNSTDVDPVQLSTLHGLFVELRDRLVKVERNVADMQQQLQVQKQMHPHGSAQEKLVEETKDYPPLSVDEKKSLSDKINNLSGNYLVAVVNIIQEDTPLGDQSEEIEIDLDALSNETLRKLQNFVMECSREETPVHRSRTTVSSRLHSLAVHEIEDEMDIYSDDDRYLAM